MKRAAVIIINRNLPEVTDRLYRFIKRNDGDVADVFVIESGSDPDKLSRYHTWWANWKDSVAQGLRTPRGFNYALSRLSEENRFGKYEFFFLVPNDAEFEGAGTVKRLIKEMDLHPRLGILAPCAKTWGEYRLLGKNATKYFWYISPGPWFFRRQYIEDVMERENPDHMNFLYDGTNFRGYESNIELIAKGYANDWGSAITTKVMVEENESYLKTRAEVIKTDPYETNMRKYVEEGKKWLRRKYGFNNRWTLQMYSKFFYEKFFDYYPGLRKYRV
ncbi:MAG: hypothetical protein HY550_09735 [Elusimicrobia bacterium]|nr:hypothetical protein [Elusimicrobiota bacterium]